MYKINLNENGKVNAILKSGKDLVKTELPEANVKAIIDEGPVTESDRNGYGIYVNGWYFDATFITELVNHEGSEDVTEEEIVKPVRSSKSPFSRK